MFLLLTAGALCGVGNYFICCASVRCIPVATLPMACNMSDSGSNMCIQVLVIIYVSNVSLRAKDIPLMPSKNLIFFLLCSVMSKWSQVGS